MTGHPSGVSYYVISLGQPVTNNTCDQQHSVTDKLERHYCLGRENGYFLMLKTRRLQTALLSGRRFAELITVFAW